VEPYRSNLIGVPDHLLFAWRVRFQALWHSPPACHRSCCLDFENPNSCYSVF
jgi:hypothetical protein